MPGKITELAMTQKYDTIVVGGGVIGLCIAWRTSQLGLSTIVCERGTEPRGASWAAAGMLAPVTEATFGEDRLLRLNLESANLYPGFLQELSDSTGMSIESSVEGTLFAAVHRDQWEALARLYDFQRSVGLPAEWLDSAACRDLEPGLHPGTRAAIFAPRDVAVDPRRVLDALTIAVRRAGGEIRFSSAVGTVHAAPDGGVSLESGERLSSAAVVLSAGCWSGSIEGSPPELARALRPVKGQILRLQNPRSEPPLLNHVVRTEDVYMVPRATGELAVGATVEEKGFDTTLTAGAVVDLLKAAEQAAPGIREYELSEAVAGLRPGTPDNAPLLGKTSVDGVIAATGHFRNGVLLAPITASAIATLIAKGEAPDDIAGFECTRFL